MELKQYQEKSKRTLNGKLTNKEQISNMLLGIQGETGEIADIFKKHFYQGHDIDFKHLQEEIGDTMFYITNLCNVLGFDLETVIEKNYEKLLTRYPNGFDKNKSINR